MKFKKKYSVVILLAIITFSTFITSVKINNNDAHTGDVHEEYIYKAVRLCYDVRNQFPGMVDLYEDLYSANLYVFDVYNGVRDADDDSLSQIAHAWDPYNKRGMCIELDSGLTLDIEEILSLISEILSEYGIVYNDLGENLIHDGAAWAVNYYFDEAVSLYVSGDKEEAYYNLGKAIHMIQDVTIPYHTAGNQFMSGIDQFGGIHEVSDVINVITAYLKDEIDLTGKHTDFEAYIDTELFGSSYQRPTTLNINDLAKMSNPIELSADYYNPAVGNSDQYFFNYYYGPSSFVQSAALFGRSFYDLVNDNIYGSSKWSNVAKRINDYCISITALFLYYFWNCVTDVYDHDNNSATTMIKLDIDGDMLSGYDEYNHVYVDGYTTHACMLSPFYTDSDYDGVDDDVEFQNSDISWSFTDSDNDGLSDFIENQLGSSTTSTDSDDDSLSDGEEYFGLTRPLSSYGGMIGKVYSDPTKLDTDNDGLGDSWEINGDLFYNIPGSSFDGNCYTDPNNADSDNDGLDDYWGEMYNGFDPNDPDMDDDGLLDGEEVNIYNTFPDDDDSDNDNIPDGEEVIAGEDGYITDPLDPDTDNDCLLDGEEVILGIDGYFTNPLNPDSDNDGLKDGGEFSYHTNPLNPDTDGDGISDGEEIYEFTPISDPLNPFDPNYMHPTAPTVTEVIEEPSLYVSWQPVAIADYYEVYINTNPVCYASTTGTTLTITGLEYMTSYYIRIRAFINSGYMSDFSSSTAQTTYTPITSPPTGLTSPSQTYNTIYLTWNPSQYATYYKIYKGGELICTTSDCEFTAPDLTPDTSYDFKVLAGNIKGESDYSDTITVQTTPPPPSTPTNLASPSQTATSIDLTWDASTGATYYRIWYTQGSYTAITSSYNCYCTLTFLLVPNTEYSIKILAVNQYGESPYTDPIEVSTLMTPPSTPTTAPTYSNIGASSVTVTLDSDPSATSYKLYKNGVFYCESTSTSISVTGLASGTTYHFKYTACNNGGESDYSPDSTVTTIFVPGAPTSCTAVSSTSDSVSLSWQKPSNVGTTTGLSYKIYMKIGTTYTLIRTQAHSGTLSAVQQYTKYGLTVGVKYYFRIYSVFNGVESTSYASASATVMSGGYMKFDIPITNELQDNNAGKNLYLGSFLFFNLLGLIAICSLFQANKFRKISYK